MGSFLIIFYLALITIVIFVYLCFNWINRIFNFTELVGKCDCTHCGACHYLRSMRGAYQHGNGKEQYARY